MHLIVVGVQWGDEGKGKIVDWLAKDFDAVVRFQGGSNAGHTLVVNNETVKLSLIPSCVLRKDKLSILGGGMVIDPALLYAEIERLKKASSIDINVNNLVISDNASLIFNFHKTYESLIENMLGSDKIGTTAQGIGPAYEDRVGRRSIRMCDLRDENLLKEKLLSVIEYYNLFIKNNKMDLPLISFEEEYQNLMKYKDFLLSYISPVWRIISKMGQSNKSILFEGAQGVMLDVVYGTYPYVTSSSTLACNALSGSGLKLQDISYVLGVSKAYTTRVGNGSFPTEDFDEGGDKLRDIGKEVGTVTQRKRRCGWFDAVMVRQAILLSGINAIVLTKLDVLDEFEEIKICVGYEYQGETYDYLPSHNISYDELKPKYKTFPGWRQSISSIKSKEELPKELISYIKSIEELIGVPIVIISTSPERENTILLEEDFLLQNS